MSDIQSTGTMNNLIEIKDLHTWAGDYQEWLIAYGRDEESGILLWHEIRLLNEEKRQELINKLTDARIDWEMINLTSARLGEPFSIEEYIEGSR